MGADRHVLKSTAAAAALVAVYARLQRGNRSSQVGPPRTSKDAGGLDSAAGLSCDVCWPSQQCRASGARAVSRGRGGTASGGSNQAISRDGLTTGHHADYNVTGRRWQVGRVSAGPDRTLVTVKN